MKGVFPLLFLKLKVLLFPRRSHPQNSHCNWSKANTKNPPSNRIPAFFSASSEQYIAVMNKNTKKTINHASITRATQDSTIQQLSLLKIKIQILFFSTQATKTQGSI